MPSVLCIVETLYAEIDLNVVESWLSQGFVVRGIG